MLISAKFPSTCAVCQRRIMIGDRIAYVRGSPVSHAMCSTEGQVIAREVAASKAATSDVAIPCPPELDYLPYQKAGIAFAMNRRNTLIADEMGLGKTVQAIGIINASPDIDSVLVVCPASLKVNWEQELLKWLTRDMSVAIYPSKADIVIINYDILAKLGPEARADLLVLDEAQYVKNPKAKRTTYCHALARRCGRVLELTGTPILNKPIELWSLLQIACPESWDQAGEGAGFFRYAKRYCDAHQEYIPGRGMVWNFDGASNLDELQEKLRSTCMVRRMKKDVLTELPPKRRSTVFLTCTDSMAEECLPPGWGSLDLDELRRAVTLGEMSTRRRELAVAKGPAVVEFVKEALETSEKILLFAHHRELIDYLRTELAEYNPACITGETSPDRRQAEVDDFQKEPSCRLIILSIHAAGVGLTLTAGSHVIFAELDWTPGVMSQAEDRAHRIGQRNSVLIQHLVVKGSLDSRISSLLIKKQAILDAALDKGLEYVDPSTRPVVPQPIEVSDEQKALALAQLRYLAARCDGAQQKDGSGFNKLDAGIGKSLARQTKLSHGQANYALRMLKKYNRQLEGF